MQVISKAGLISAMTILGLGLALTSIGAPQNDKSARLPTGLIHYHEIEHLDAVANYKPPLPVPNFINTDQAELFRLKGPKVEDLVYFADKVEPEHPELRDIGEPLKAWTTEEREDIQKILDTTLRMAPGLLIQAANGSKLALCRISSCSPVRDESLGMSLSMIPEARSHPGAVVLADSFFTTSKQFNGLVHELVHEADKDGRMCYSRDWVEFINPTIERARLKVKTSSTSVAQAVANELQTNTICPTAYSYSGLKEALAEMTAAYITDEHFVANPDFVTRFARPLLLPVAKDIAIASKYKQGLISYNNRQYNQAIAPLMYTVDCEPQCALPHTYMGSAYAHNCEYLKAAEEEKKALECFKTAGAMWTEKDMRFTVDNLVHYYGLMKEPDRGIALINELLSYVPYDCAALYERSTLDYLEKRFGDAARDIFLAFTCSDYADLFRDAAAGPEMLQQRLDQDVSAFPRVNFVFSRRAHFFEWLGDRESDGGKKKSLYARALSDYEKAFQLDRSFSPSTAFDCCNIHLKLNDQRQAEIYESKCLAAKPDGLETMVLEAQLFDASGKQSEAKAKCWQICRRFGNELTVKLSRTFLAMGMKSVTRMGPGNWLEPAKESLEDCSKEIDANPTDALAYDRRGWWYSSIGEHAKAIADFSKAIKLDPDDEYAYANRGDEHDNLHEWRKAIDDFSRALRINPRNADTYVQRGLSYSRIGEHAKAITDFSKAIALNPEDENAYRNRGNEYSHAGDARRALQNLNKAISLDPNDYYAYAMRADTYGNLGRHKQAIADYSKAIGINASHEYSFLYRGEEHLVVGEKLLALSDFTRAISLDAKDPDAYMARARLYSKMGRHKESINDYSMLLRFVDNKTAIEARKSEYIKLAKQKQKRTRHKTMPVKRS